MLQNGVMKPPCDRTSADYDDVVLQTWINKTDKEPGDKFTSKLNGPQPWLGAFAAKEKK